MDSPLQAAARQTIKRLLRSNTELCVTPQNLIELWNVCTRPLRDNGFGKSIAATERYCRFLESVAVILPESPSLFTHWRNLVIEYQVNGKQVHDARLVAAMHIHRVPAILTFNAKDFKRYRFIEALCPQEDAALRPES